MFSTRAIAPAAYEAMVLADGPAVLWRSPASGTTVTDLSGNGNHAKLYTSQAVSNSGMTLAQASLPVGAGASKALRLNNTWSGGNPAYFGMGIRADAYKAYIPGSKRTLEFLTVKTEADSFATTFSGSGGNHPHTTLTSAIGTSPLPSTIPVADTSGSGGWDIFPSSGANLTITGISGYISYTSKDATHFYGCTLAPGGSGSASNGAAVVTTFGAPHPTWELLNAPTAEQAMRFYANVDNYPVSWVDWGTANTGFPDSDFDLNLLMHLAMVYDDSTGIAEFFVNGASQGQQGPLGYFGIPIQYNRVSDPGLLQFGWRGGLPVWADPGNGETYGGTVDCLACYERLLDPEEIARHAKSAFGNPSDGTRHSTGRLHVRGAKSAVLAFSGHDHDTLFDDRRVLMEGIADGGFTVSALDVAQTWGNSTVRTATSTLKTASQAWAATAASHLIAEGIGAITALNWAKNNTSSVKSITLIDPVLDLQAVHSANRGNFAALIATAHGGTPTDANNPADNTATFAAMPILMYHGSTSETLVTLSEWTTFAAAVDAEVFIDTEPDPVTVRGFMLRNE